MRVGTRMEKRATCTCQVRPACGMLLYYRACLVLCWCQACMPPTAFLAQGINSTVLPPSTLSPCCHPQPTQPMRQPTAAIANSTRTTPRTWCAGQTAPAARGGAPRVGTGQWACPACSRVARHRHTSPARPSTQPPPCPPQRAGTPCRPWHCSMAAAGAVGQRQCAVLEFQGHIGVGCVEVMLCLEA